MFELWGEQGVVCGELFVGGEEFVVELCEECELVGE